MKIARHQFLGEKGLGGFDAAAGSVACAIARATIGANNCSQIGNVQFQCFAVETVHDQLQTAEVLELVVGGEHAAESSCATGPCLRRLQGLGIKVHAGTLAAGPGNALTAPFTLVAAVSELHARGMQVSQI